MDNDKNWRLLFFCSFLLFLFIFVALLSQCVQRILADYIGIYYICTFSTVRRIWIACCPPICTNNNLDEGKKIGSSEKRDFFTVHFYANIFIRMHEKKSSFLGTDEGDPALDDWPRKLRHKSIANERKKKHFNFWCVSNWLLLVCWSSFVPFFLIYPDLIISITAFLFVTIILFVVRIKIYLNLHIVLIFNDNELK